MIITNTFFQISDTDNDGLLNDKELNEFQVSWYHSWLYLQTAIENLVYKAVQNAITRDNIRLVPSGLDWKAQIVNFIVQ